MTECLDLGCDLPAELGETFTMYGVGFQGQRIEVLYVHVTCPRGHRYSREVAENDL